MEVQKLFNQLLKWKVGRKSLIKIWKEPWIFDHMLLKPIVKPNLDVKLVKEKMNLNGDE